MTVQTGFMWGHGAQWFGVVTWDDLNGKISLIHVENNDTRPHYVVVDWKGVPVGMDGQQLPPDGHTKDFAPGETFDITPPPNVRWDRDPFTIRTG